MVEGLRDALLERDELVGAEILEVIASVGASPSRLRFRNRSRSRRRTGGNDVEPGAAPRRRRCPSVAFSAGPGPPPAGAGGQTDRGQLLQGLGHVGQGETTAPDDGVQTGGVVVEGP